MSSDANGFSIKPGHSQDTAAQPFGPSVYVLERCDGKVYGVWTSRHDAVAARTIRFRNTVREEWLDVRYVPVGSLRIQDLVVVDG